MAAGLKRWLRRAAVLIGSLVLLVLVALIAGWVWLGTDSGQSTIKGLIEDQVNGILEGGALSVGSFNTDFLESLSLEDITLTEPGGRAVVQVERVEAEFALRRLLSGSLPISSLHIERPSVDVVVDDDGVSDFTRIFGEGEEDPGPSAPWGGLPIKLKVKEAGVTDGRFTWTTPDDRWALEEINLSLAADGHKREVRLSDIALSATLTSHEDTPLSLGGDVAYLNGDVMLDAVALRVGDSRVQLDGELRAAETAPAFDLTVKVQSLSTDDLETLLGDLGLKGDLSGALRVSGPLSDLSIAGGVTFPEGRVSADIGLNLSAEVPTWSVALTPDGLKLGAFVEAITEPVNLTGELTLAGEGFSWPDGMTAAGALSLEEPILWGYELLEADSRLAIRDGALWVEGLSIETPWASADGDGRITADGVALDLSADVRELAALSEFGVSDIYGRAVLDGTLSVDWSGDETDIRFQGQLNGGDLMLPGNVMVNSAAGPVLVTVDGAGTHAQGIIEAQAVAVGALFVQELRSPWDVVVDNLGSLRFDLEPSVIGLDIAEVPLADAAEGTVTGGIPAGGDISAEVELVFTGIVPDRYNWGRGGLSATMDGDLVVLSLDIEDSEENIFSFVADMDTDDLDVRIVDFQFAPSRDVRWRSESAMALQVLDDGVSIAGVHLSSAAGELMISGRFVTDGELDAEVVIKDFDLEWLARFVPSVAEGWVGLVSMNVALGGRGSAPVISGEVGVQGVSIPDAVNKLTGDLSVLLTSDMVTLKGALGLPDKRLLGIDGFAPLDFNLSEPELDLENPYSLRLVLLPSNAIELSTLLPALPALPGALEVSAEIVAAGSLGEPTLAMSWSSRVPVSANIPSMWLDGSMTYAGDSISLVATGRGHTRRLLSVQGTAVTKVPEVLAWYLDGEGAEPDLEAYDTWVDDMDIRVVPLGLPMRTIVGLAGLKADVEGRLAGGLAVRGSPLDPKVYAGFLITDGRAGAVAFGVPQFSLSPVLGGYQFDLKANFQQDGEPEPGELSVAAYVPFDLRGGTVDIDQQLARDSLLIEVHGQGIPLAMISAFEPEVREAEGTFAISERRNRVTGSLANPELDLEFSIADGSFFYDPIGVKIEALNMETQLANDRIRLKDFHLETVPIGSRNPDADRGTLDGSGDIKVADWAPGEVTTTLVADHMWLINDRQFRVQVSGELGLGGEWPNVQVSGKVATDEARLNLGESFWLGEQTLSLDPAILIVRSDEDQEEEEGRLVASAPAFYELWDINLNLDIPPQTARLDVEMPMETSYGKVSAALSKIEMDSWLTGTLDFGMNRGEISLSGEVETRRGEATVFGNDFDLEEGLIRFGGTAYADPILNIKAVHSTTQYGDITVTIRDSVSDLDLSFSSSEDWTDTDIASILLIGMPTSDLSQAQGGAGAGLLTAALAMMGQAAADAGLMAGLDLLEVDNSDDGIGGIRAGRALSDSLFLIVGVNFSPEENENTTEATIEWLISRQIFAEFVTGDAGESSADVYSRWRF